MGQWISIENCFASFANKADRKDRTGESDPLFCNRMDSPRINHRIVSRPPLFIISWSKFADVTVAQRQARDGRTLRISGSKPDPLLSPEEEEFLFLRVEVLRDIDRPAN